MELPTQAELLDRIDAFLARHEMKESRLSRDATGEPGLVSGMRRGRSPTLATLEKLADHMARKDSELAEPVAAEVGAPPPPFPGTSCATCSSTPAPPPSASDRLSPACSAGEAAA